MPPSAIADESLIPTRIEPEHLGVVLFDFPADRLPAFAADLRRLSRQPVTFRLLSTGDDEPGRVLVRIERPPPLLVRRFVDAAVAAVRLVSSVPVAYGEQSPGVWVQLGYRHPGIDRVSSPAACWLLIRAPLIVETVGAAEFGGEIGDLQLSAAKRVVLAGRLAFKIPVRLRLIPNETQEPPRLWVIRHDALGQLTAYCRTAHQQLLTRFTVAVSASAGVPSVVLRALKSKGPPPIFVGPATAFHPLLRLPNVYIPAGMRLAPPIRRDVLRAALGVAPERVAWLHPLDGGAFRIESLPEAAFRSLSDWIEYRSADEPRSITAWMQSHRWGLATFIERPESKARPSTITSAPHARSAPARTSRGLLSRTLGWLKRFQLQPPAQLTLPTPVAEEQAVSVDEAVKTALDQGHRLHLARPETVISSLERCRTLEARFLQNLPTIQSGPSTEIWSELAAAYSSAGNHADAALCWLNALWGQVRPPKISASGWLSAEAKAARPEVKELDPESWLKAVPGPGATRTLAAWVVWASVQQQVPSALTERAAAIQSRLEAHENWLPVRAVWLVRMALARLGSADVLGVARTRDRLAERLLATGLSMELDTPSFLRFAGDGMRERFHEARRWLADKRGQIHEWIARLPEDARIPSALTPGTSVLRRVGLEPDIAHTRAYADLILAWGLTRFGEYNAADTIRKQASASLSLADPVHALLHDGFEYRIAQVREGKPPRGPLPNELLRRIEVIKGTGRYAIDKLREYSRILEPTIRVDGYAHEIYRKADPRTASPADALNTLDAERLNDETDKVLTAELDRVGRPHIAAVVTTLLDRAFELNEAGINNTLAALPGALDASRDAPRQLARLLDKGLAAAALWDRADVARELATRFLQLSDGRAGWDVAETLTSQAFRCLRRLGLKSDADEVLRQVADRILQGQPIGRLRASRPGEWPVALRVLLHAAAGWYFAGNEERAHQVLDEARRDLFASETTPPNRTLLALTYAATLAQAPARVALGRLEEVFQRLKGIKVEGSTNEYFALNALLLVETAVRAVISDEFAVGPQVRAWLDDDELTVRRRIRDELKAMLAKQEL